MISILYLSVISEVILTQVGSSREIEMKIFCSSSETLSKLRIRPSFTPEFMAKSPQLFPELRNPRFHVESNSFRGKPAPASPPAPRPQIVPEIRGGAKPITNPLLQELFHKNSIVFQTVPMAGSVSSLQPTPAPASVFPPSSNNLPGFDVKRPALTFAKEEPRTFAEPQPRPTPLPLPARGLERERETVPGMAAGAQEKEEKQRRLFQSILSRKKEKERRLQDILTRQQMKVSPTPPPSSPSPPPPSPPVPQFEAIDALARPGRARIISAAEAAVANRQNTGAA